MPGKKGVPRLQSTTAADLRNTATRLRKAAAAISGLAESLDETKKKAVDVEGQQSVEAAFDALSKYVANCQKKIREF